MGRPLRHLSRPYAPVEITIRTIRSMFLLRPSDELNQLFLGIIGRALALLPVRLHCLVILSNHMHMILSPLDVATLAAFMCRVNGEMAKAACRINGWGDKVWSRRYTCLEIVDDESLLDRCRYLLSHGCKENLVRRPADWPGVHCISALARGEPLLGKWIDRTAEAARLATGKRVSEDEITAWYDVGLDPLPIHEGKSEPEIRSFWQGMEAEIECETVRRLTVEKAPVLGRKAILRQRPLDRPETSKKRLLPLCHAASKALRKEYRDRYHGFVTQFRQALQVLLSGDPFGLSLFPDGCCIPPVANRQWRLQPTTG